MEVRDAGSLSLLPSASDARAQVAGVGPSGCIYLSVQDAINAAPSGGTVFIAVSAASNIESLIVTKPLNIRGAEPGSNCLSAVSSGGKAIITAPPGQRTMSVNTSGVVKLFDLSLRDGEATTGANLWAIGGATVDLRNVAVFGGKASGQVSGFGGGIAERAPACWWAT